MRRTSTLAVAGFLMIFGTIGVLEAQTRPSILVFKSPFCGCCTEWVGYLENEGFSVRVEDVQDLRGIKKSYGVPPTLESCHTAVVEGYLIEGHVPAEVIRRLLARRPEVAGISVPGMPIGSPGMEVPGTPADPYDVIAFDEEGATTVFSSYP